MVHRGTAVVALMIGLALAGCLGGTTPESQGPTGDASDELSTDGLPVVLDARRNLLDQEAYPGEVPSFDVVKVSDRISGEPTIGITRDGTVFYPAIDFDAAVGLPRTVYMRSTDGGDTWEEANPAMAGVETHPTTFDPYVYTDPTTGRVYAMDMGPHVACNKVSWSDDDGDSWVTRDGACIPGVNDHPTLFAGPALPGTDTAIYPNTLYLCVNQVTDSLCYRSPDGGINWYATEPPYPGYDEHRGFCGGLHGHGQASWADDGSIYLGRDWCGRPTVAVSQDGGHTWERTVISSDPRHDPRDHDVAIATDTAGNAYAFWVADGGNGVFLSRSFDHGYSWTTPINVTAPGVTAVKLPSIIGGSTGRIAFQYVGTENPYGWAVDDMKEDCDDGDDPECYEHPDAYDNATWNAYIGTSLDANATDPTFATVMVNPEDEPLKRGGCAGRCFGDDGGMYDFLDINIDPTTGRIWSALVDVCSGECDDADGKFSTNETAVGAAARLIDGTRLLEEPIAERQTLLPEP